jgi:hypothetical protein
MNNLLLDIVTCPTDLGNDWGEAGNKHIFFLNVLNVISLSPVAHIHEEISVKKLFQIQSWIFQTMRDQKFTLMNQIMQIFFQFYTTMPPYIFPHSLQNHLSGSSSRSSIFKQSA